MGPPGRAAISLFGVFTLTLAAFCSFLGFASNPDGGAQQIFLTATYALGGGNIVYSLCALLQHARSGDSAETGIFCPVLSTTAGIAVSGVLAAGWEEEKEWRFLLSIPENVMEAFTSPGTL
ncbi:hypothetical protein JX265_007773 [Neoarthrinium moseri]|uniref:Uncharacterized protein n=1 Tax=Neoarthrinium moseri TaxID=1658444 RepID=A0A9P9WJA9_9PEZI|nr:uncharacterized protein JN550_003352 [Neoarthrinium moseri]KAI1866472.1 hypothetical protein JX265_007773 [Neoarthrinium moseri]KAI1873099.1 hypothetical protein JN550_003352 [Neoarthrinium moseri]